MSVGVSVCVCVNMISVGVGCVWGGGGGGGESPGGLLLPCDLGQDSCHCGRPLLRISLWEGRGKWDGVGMGGRGGVRAGGWDGLGWGWVKLLWGGLS